MTTTRTLRQHLTTAAIKAGAGFVVAASVIIAAHSTTQTMTVGTPAPAPAVDHAFVAAQELVAAHGCWTGEPPADVTIPGHVVVIRDGEAVHGGQHLVAKALGQAFDGEDHGLRIIAFCR